jgi:hypothetical protein
MRDIDIDPDVLAERTDRQVKRTKTVVRVVFLAISALLFIIFQSIAWVALGSSADVLPAEVGEAVLTAQILMTVGWGLSLMYQLMTLILDIPASEKALRRQIGARLVNELMMERYITPSGRKAKRDDEGGRLVDDEPMTVGDDGELISEREQRARRR